MIKDVLNTSGMSYVLPISYPNTTVNVNQNMMTIRLDNPNPTGFHEFSFLYTVKIDATSDSVVPYCNRASFDVL